MSNSSSSKLGGQCLVVGGIISFIIFIIQILIGGPPPGNEHIFSYFANEVPGFFYRLGGMPIGEHPNKGYSHHTPDFYVDDDGMLLGIKTMTTLAIDYLMFN